MRFTKPCTTESQAAESSNRGGEGECALEQEGGGLERIWNVLHPVRRYPSAASEQSRNNENDFKGFYLKARARIWP